MAIITVTTLDDSLAVDGDVSLREALQAANTDTSVDGSTTGSGADTIVFDPGLAIGNNPGVDDGQLVLDSGVLSELSITSDVTIDGDTDSDDVADIAIDAAGNSRVFLFTGGTSTLDALVLTGGDEVEGGAMRIGAADVTIVNSIITGNEATDGGALWLATGATVRLSRTSIVGNEASSDGGAIYLASLGTLTVIDSTLAGNTAGSAGGAIYGFATNAITLTNTTLSGNLASDAGGAIYAFGGDLTLVNATVTGNSAGGNGGGLYGKGAGGTTTLVNSIVAGNEAGADGNDLHGGTDVDLTFVGANVIGSAPDSFNSVTGTTPTQIDGADRAALETVFADVRDDPITNVLSGALADNGGRVPTVALNPSGPNPARGTGDATQLSEATAGVDFDGDGNTTDVLTTDARGFTRNVGGLDLGAFEAQATASFLVDTLQDGGADDYDGNDLAAESADGDGLSLREALALANNVDPASPDTIRFAAAPAGGTLVLASGEFVVDGSVTIDGDIDGDGEFDITVSASALTPSAVFHVYNGTSTLNGLHVTHGQALYGAGVAVGAYAAYGYADVTISNSLISDNDALFGAGISVDTGSSLRLVRSTVLGNNAYLGGGIAVNDGGSLTAIDSTISGNRALPILGYGGGIANAGTTTLINTTVSGNAGYAGGGLYNSGILSLVNTTVAQNGAQLGGGIYNADCGCGLVNVISSTVAGNYGYDGGGIYNAAGLVNLTNSIVAGNFAAGVGRDILNLDVMSYSGANVFSQSGLGDAQDIIETNLADIFASVVPFDFDGPGSVPGFLTGELADNGGPARTVAIRPGGVARDAGDTGQLPPDIGDLDGDNVFAEELPFDARGLQRVVGDVVDVGAVEAQSRTPNDSNGDQRSDVLWRSDDGTVALWEMDGVAVLSNTGIATLPPYWHIADGDSDFNRDGTSDIVWRDDSGTVVLWEMDGAAILDNTTIATLPSYWHIADTGDFTGDGRADILWRDDAGTLVLWEMDGATILANATVGTIAATTRIEETADFTGDGRNDILLREAGGTVRIWEMDGATVVSDTAVVSLPDYWQFADTGDLNGDGRSDILWRDDAGTVVLWEMDGATITDNTALGTLSDHWNIADVGDYTGDARSDILWRDDAGTVVLWEMDGPTILDNTAVNTIPTNWHIVA